jgi:LmeA-like phospholipid-binding
MPMTYDRADEAVKITQTATRSVGGGSYGCRRGGRWLVTIVIIAGVLLGLDFGARAVAESVMASKIQRQGLHSKPSVSIDGFPFLTQVASRNFSHVTISAADVPAGPVTITTIDAAATGIRLSSYAFSSGTIGNISGTALISFGSLASTLTAQFGPLGALLNGTGLNLADAGPDEVRATLNLVVTSGSAVWRVTRVNASTLNVHLVSSTGLPSSLLGSIQDLNLQIPKLPLGLTIDRVTVTPGGVVGQVRAHDVPFGT